MSAVKLRLLADCLEREFMTVEDRKAWMSALRGCAKSIERRREDSREWRTRETRGKT
jgi:hypothetical protein